MSAPPRVEDLDVPGQQPGLPGPGRGLRRPLCDRGAGAGDRRGPGGRARRLRDDGHHRGGAGV